MKLSSLTLWSLGIWHVGLAAACGADPTVRPPAVQGKFYPDGPAELRLAVEKYLAAAPAAPAAKPLGIVAPHAGYVFSGQICANAFRRAQGHDYELVVILGTNHTVPGFRGVALYPRGAFRTPLGDVSIDEKVIAELASADSICTLDARPHVREHSVEVQLPFVQHLFPKARIVAAVVGSPEVELCTRFGKALAKVIEKRRALIVASSDLSHYPAYDDAKRVDRRVLEAFATLDPAKAHAVIEAEERQPPPNLSTCACGEAPVLALLAATKALGATRAEIVSYANSGDTGLADKDRVVGYGAIAVYGGDDKGTAAPAENAVQASEDDDLRPEDKKALLALARESIAVYLKTGKPAAPKEMDPRLSLKRGAFVTLKKKGDLRGCIGHMREDTPLCEVVGGMALQAAFSDPRFPPLRAVELPEVEIEISVLTPAKPVASVKEIVVGRDGVVLRKAGRSAVFLPQVAPEQGWTRDEMLDHLAMKAGLARDSWREGAEFSTFRALVFHESEFK